MYLCQRIYPVRRESRRYLRSFLFPFVTAKHKWVASENGIDVFISLDEFFRIKSNQIRYACLDTNHLTEGVVMEIFEVFHKHRFEDFGIDEKNGR